MELKAPLLVLERTLWPDSGGPGRFRGGLGVQTTIRSLVDGRWNVGPPGHRTGCPPWGLSGGSEGAVGHTLIRYPGKDELEPSLIPRQFAPAGTEVIYRTSGGGGWGDPFARAPDRVLRDVTEGYISAEAARARYGVVLGADGATVDEAATAELRAERRTE